MRRTRSDKLEETIIAVLLGLMTLITFANVVARFLDSNILWALQLTVFLFAWLVLLGASYCVKINAHLGVDLIVNSVHPPARRIIGLLSVGVCLAFSLLMLKGAWDYWANFANLPGTEGRWFPLGFEENYRDKGWYEVDSVPLPEFLRWMQDAFNEGEEYEKIPRLIPYAVLPLSMALLVYRFAQAAWAIWAGKSDRIVVSHEVEAELKEIRADQSGKKT